MVRLKSNDRIIIQACLTRQMSITEIATRLKRSTNIRGKKKRQICCLNRWRIASVNIKTI